MGFISNFNKVLNSQSASVFLFGFTGAYKVLKDYQNAPYYEKKNVLYKDTAILAGSAAGLAAYTMGRKNFINSPLKKQAFNFANKQIDKIKNTNFWKSDKNILKKPIKFLAKSSYNILRDSIDSTLILLSGVAGGVTTNYLINLGHTHKKYIDDEIEEKSKIIKEDFYNKNNKIENNLFNNNNPNNLNIDNPFNKIKKNIPDDFKHLDHFVNEKTKKSIIYNIYNMPEMRVFNNSFIGLQSFRIAEEKTFKDKLKHTTKSVLKDTLIPVFFLSLSTSITKGMKSIYRIPIVFSSLVAGTMFANKKLASQIAKFDTEQTKKKVVY